MKEKSVVYMVVGPLVYRFVSDFEIEVDGSYAHFFHEHLPVSDTDVKLKVVCEINVAEGEIPIDGQLVYHDTVNSVFVNAKGQETRVMTIEGKPYAVCRESLNASLELILSRACLSDGNICISMPILEALMMERFMVMCGGLILHSSFIIHEGEAILFTAPSGTGKSTQASLWQRYAGAEIINGDRSVVWYDGQQFMASGLPFCGSSGINKDRTVPLACIAFIEQWTDNNACSMPVAVSARKLFGEMSINKWNHQFVDLALDMIERLVASVPMVHLQCNMEEGAVTALRTYLAQSKGNDG
ncbi:MAG: hypothetical protein IKH26_13145 [Bacteroidaceae bacterium]|nr:hypothetical protein [Bacteroidaceae bacterium]